MASPNTILAHHGAALYLLWDACARSRGPVCASVVLMVEFNTLLLLARRHLPRHWALEFVFFSSWIAIRVLLPLRGLPVIISDGDGTYLSRPATGLLLAMTALQCKWTVDLVRKTLHGCRNSYL